MEKLSNDMLCVLINLHFHKNMAGLDHAIYIALKELKNYRDTNLTPEQVSSMKAEVEDMIKNI